MLPGDPEIFPGYVTHRILYPITGYLGLGYLIVIIMLVLGKYMNIRYLDPWV